MSDLFRPGAPNLLEFLDVHDAALRQNSGIRAYLNTGAGSLTFYRESGEPVPGATGVLVVRVATVPGKWEALVSPLAEFVRGERVQYRGTITGDVEGGDANVTAPLEGWVTVLGAEARYGVEGHPLLSERARMLTPDELTAQATLAESVLGLTELDVTLDQEKLGRARMAVALQVNLQLATPAEALAMTSQGRGGRSATYRDDIPQVHPTAALIVRQLLGRPEYRRVTGGMRDPQLLGDDRHERLRGTPRGDRYPW